MKDTTNVPLVSNGCHYTTYKNLSKEQRKCLLSQGIALTWPGSFFGWFFLSLYPVLLMDTICFHRIRNFVGLAVATAVIIISYVLGNILQKWFLHQLITNTCKVSTETVCSINIGEKGGITQTLIQFVTTENHSDIPTLYRGISQSINVDSEVFIIHMKNGARYALAVKKSSKKGLLVS